MPMFLKKLSSQQDTSNYFKWFSILLILSSIGAAIINYGYYRPDEHFQTIEFASYKLGITPVESLPWEFKEKLRPFLQSAIYLGIAKLLNSIGVTDHFTWSLFFRLFSALIGITAFLTLLKVAIRRFTETEAQTTIVFSSLFFLLPYLITRTSSESLSGSLFALALAAVLYQERPDNGAPSKITPLFCILAGIAAGFAFELRFQTILMTLGLAAWLIIIKKMPLGRLAFCIAGFAVPVAIGAIIDRWGYGQWCFPFYEYFRVNILESRTAQFGSSPFFAYIYLMHAHPFFIVSLFLMVSTFVLWIRRPLDAVTWTTVPFFAFHCLVGHKEERFLFPMVMPLIIYAVHAYSGHGRLQRFALWMLHDGKLRFSTCCIIINSIGILYVVHAIYPFNTEAYIRHQCTVAHEPQVRYFALGWNPYERKELHFSFYGNTSAVQPFDIAQIRPGDQLFVPHISGDAIPESLRSKVQLVQTCHPFLNIPNVRQLLLPVVEKTHQLVPAISCPSRFEVVQ